mgnify:FL=1
MPIFGGSDTGVEGAIASLRADADGHVEHVRLFATPTRAREEGGREVIAVALRGQVYQAAPAGWDRWLVERPVRGGMVRQERGTEFAQGDSHGAMRAVLELAAASTGSPLPEAVKVGSGGWHARLDLPTAKDSDKRKALLVVEAERLLAALVGKGAKLDPLAPCRRYAGLIGGQAAPRSGAADALLLAWLAYRKWRGVTDGAPLLCIDPAWKPEPKPPRARARKSPVPENMS